MGILSQLLEELDSGRLKVVDLTSPLGPDTPVIDLPPIFAPSPGLTLTEISRYDSRVVIGAYGMEQAPGARGVSGYAGRRIAFTRFSSNVFGVPGKGT